MIKVKKRKILLLPGDGIGPEVIAEVKKIINWFNDNKSLDFEKCEQLFNKYIGIMRLFDDLNKNIHIFILLKNSRQ